MGGTPKMRVVDDRGCDAYLSVEYRWRSDYFDEDFGPDRVRKFGDEATVWELVCSVEGVEQCPSLGPKMRRVPYDPPRSCQSMAEGPQLCDVCMDKPCNSILIPCLHGGLCEKCAQRIANNGAAGGSRCPHCRTLIQAVTNVGERQQRQSFENLYGGAVSSGGSRTSGWRWPAWCQKKGLGLLEVYVVDSQANRREWVKAQPKMCVIDGQGDKYLCAEYIWDGECFVEDFGIDRIRRKGDTLTLQQQLLLSGAIEA